MPDRPQTAHSPVVLLADASPDNAQVCGTWLAEAGFVVGHASSGPDALTKVNASMPDIVLADLALPGMDPFVLAEALRAHESTSLVPLILLSGGIQPDVLNRAAAVGIDSVLLKPCDAALLVGEIVAVLEACRQMRESTTQPERRNIRRRHADVLRVRVARLYGFTDGI